MTQDIVDKLQDKAKVLTGERRKRSKMVPEDLVTPENIREFRTIASHPGMMQLIFTVVILKIGYRNDPNTGHPKSRLMLALESSCILEVIGEVLIPR